jgi:predicted MFS family arabinose efflux permease
MDKVANNFNAPGVVFTGIMLGTIGVLSFIVQPGLVQGFVTEVGLSEADANSLAFDEMLGVAIATFVTTFCKSKINWKYILITALLLAGFGNFISAFYIENPIILPVIRFITGFGEGAIISLSFTIIGLSSRSERNLAAYLVLLLTYGALGLWIMPTAFSIIGLDGVFTIWGVLTLLSLGLVKFVPASSDNRTEMHIDTIEMPTHIKVISLVGVLLFNLAIGVAWANLFLIGMEIKSDEQAVANALLISQFVAISGALIPIFMEQKFGIFIPIIVTILGSIIAITMLIGEPSYIIFVLAVCLFNFLWNFGLPFIFTAVGNMDERGVMVSLAIALQMTGLGFGPFLAAVVLGNNGDFQDVLILIIGLYIACAIPLLGALKQHRSALSFAKEI